MFNSLSNFLTKFDWTYSLIPGSASWKAMNVLWAWDELLNELMSWVYSSKLQHLPQWNDEDLFLRKQSYATSDWVFNANQLVDWPYHRPKLLQELYENNKVQYWSNDDDLAFYEYVGMFDGQKVRAIFYNSDYRGKEWKRGKLPFNEWLKLGKYASIRICFW